MNEQGRRVPETVLAWKALSARGLINAKTSFFGFILMTCGYLYARFIELMLTDPNRGRLFVGVVPYE